MTLNLIGQYCEMAYDEMTKVWMIAFFMRILHFFIMAYHLTTLVWLIKGWIYNMLIEESNGMAKSVLNGLDHLG